MSDEALRPTPEMWRLRYLHLCQAAQSPAPTLSDLAVVYRAKDPHWSQLTMQALLASSPSTVRILLTLPCEETPFFPLLQELKASGIRHEVLPASSGIDTLQAALYQSLSSPYVVWLEEGVILPEEWWKGLLWPFFDDPNVGVTFAQSVGIASHDEPPPLTLQELTARNRALVRLHGGRWHVTSEVALGCVAVRTSLLQTHGGVPIGLATDAERLSAWLNALPSFLHKALCRDVLTLPLLPLPDLNTERLSRRSRPTGPLTETVLAPKLVTVMFVEHSGSPAALQTTLQQIRKQQAVHIELFLIRIEPEERGLPEEIDASDLFLHVHLQDRSRLPDLLANLSQFAQGEYLAYWETGVARPATYLMQMVSSLERSEWDVAVWNSDTSVPPSNLYSVVHSRRWQPVWGLESDRALALPSHVEHVQESG